MKIFAATLRSSDPAHHYWGRLSPEGRLLEVLPVAKGQSLPNLIVEKAEDSPFTLALDVPVVVPIDNRKTRKFELVLKRRFGHKLPAGGRASLNLKANKPTVAEALSTGLATLGRPVLPFPDRTSQRDGLAEIIPALSLQSLLWESSATLWGSDPGKYDMFRAFQPSPIRLNDGRVKQWQDRAFDLDLLIRSLVGTHELDLDPVRHALTTATDADSFEAAAATFDLSLMAGTLQRYLAHPDRSLFFGDRETGYVIMPADGVIRRMALKDPKRATVEHAQSLFPIESLEERLGPVAHLRSLELFAIDHKPQLIEATYSTEHTPVYKFKNVDELLWWKHCSHEGGSSVPVEGLDALHVELQATNKAEKSSVLVLKRSRHKTLSFRFDSPQQWRAHIPTRDGNAYRFKVIRSVHRTKTS